MGLKTLGSGGDAAYFTLFRSVLVRYSQSWNLPLTIAALLLLAGALGVGFRRRALTPVRVLLGFVLFPAAPQPLFRPALSPRQRVNLELFRLEIEIKLDLQKREKEKQSVEEQRCLCRV